MPRLAQTEGLTDDQRDILAARNTAHIREVREGARGAMGVQGGGCGCN